MSFRGMKAGLQNSCPVCGEEYIKISGYEWEDEKKYHHSKKWGASHDHICIYNPQEIKEVVCEDEKRN